VIQTDPARTASGVLKKGKPLSVSLPRAPGPPVAAKPAETNYRRYIMIGAAVFLIVPSLWASAKRAAKRARKKPPPP